MTVKCICGFMCDTKFCPMCGRESSKHALASLLIHCEQHRDYLEELHKHRLERGRKVTPKSLANFHKWKSWCDGLEKAMMEVHDE